MYKITPILKNALQSQYLIKLLD